jgi:signal transduction histidine kinase
MALLAAEVSDKPVEGDCTITKYAPSAKERVCCADYHVRITPFQLGRERGYVLVMNEVTSVKWRAIYERLFLHDVANLLAGLSGWAGEMVECPSLEIAQQVATISKRLNEQLESHRLLLRAEEGTSWLRPVPIDMPKIIQTLKSWFAGHECAKGRVFVIKYSNEAPNELKSDVQLLLRVLGNLITNAFEATPPLGAVTLTVTASEDETVFDVHNMGMMEPDVKDQLFKTRFSSKGDGRGLGLKAVQVFGEHCLGGTVDFTTDNKFGTKFRFSLPNRFVSAES